MLASILATVVAGLALAASAQAAPTVVSLTFDDGNADQTNALPALQGLPGTFYIISGALGTPNYLTQDQVKSIAAAGHEIGGHTVTHPDLTTVPAAEAQRQICNDRINLTSLVGARVTSFAYPYAALNTTVKNAVRTCGYNSARSLGDIKSAHSDPGVNALAGRIPPTDAYDLPAVDQIDTSWTLAQMQNVVTAAERSAAGGWVIFTFHHVCGGSSTTCDPSGLSISQTTLTQFTSWLKTRSATTSVKTIGQVIGGTVKPLVQGPAPTTTASVVNPSLETIAAGSAFPTCWMPGGWGTNTPTWTRTSDAFNGSFAEKLDVTGYSSGDAKLLPTFDLGSCAPTVTAGKAYTIATNYKSTGTTQFALYYRSTSGAWFYWTSSPWFGPAATYTPATFTTPPVPAGANGMSFGLALISNGSLTTDQYSLAPATTAAAAGTTLATTGAPVGAAHSATAAAAKSSKLPGVAKKKLTRARKGRSARQWRKFDRPFLPGGREVRPGTKVLPPFLAEDRTVR